MKRIQQFFREHKFYLLHLDTLSQRHVKVAPIVFAFLLINTLCVFTGFVSSRIIGLDIEKLTTEQKIYIINDLDKFSPTAYKQAMLDLHIKFPRVVFSQAISESKHFSSPVFIENNNSLGMKEATFRPTNNIGTNRNHAKYNTWRDCLVDYALWQSFHLKNIHSEQEYLQLLASAGYAADTNYIALIKSNLDKFDKVK